MLRDKLPKHNLDNFKTRPSILTQRNIPKPMHGLAPRVILGSAWWDLTRREAYKSTGYRCLACGTTSLKAKERKALEGHESYEIDWKKGRLIYIETVPLCHYCHSYIHCGRLHALLEQGKIDSAKYVNVMEHGDAILESAGLDKTGQDHVEMARWEEWRLVLFGELYPPLYRDYYEWCRKVRDAK